MKYLLQSDWERLVKNSERYEALCLMLRSPATIPQEPLMRDQLDALADMQLELLAEASRRANGDTDCKVCGKPYRLHHKGGPIGCGDEQFLNRLCDGSLVKL